VFEAALHYALLAINHIYNNNGTVSTGSGPNLDSLTFCRSCASLGHPILCGNACEKCFSNSASTTSSGPTVTSGNSKFDEY